MRSRVGLAVIVTGLLAAGVTISPTAGAQEGAGAAAAAEAAMPTASSSVGTGVVAPPPYFAQAPFGRPPPPKHYGSTGESAAPIDLTGYWVSIVDEDWQWRMLTARTGDTTSVPVNAAGKKIAGEFDRTRYGGPFTDNIDCRAYYMAGLMRMPERLNITWASPDVLKIQSDWGEQTRMLYFKKSDMPHTGPTPQGSSLAQWVVPISETESLGGGTYGGPGINPPGGHLEVVTDNLVPGWLRRNGIPYGSKTRVNEYFQTFLVPTSGEKWFDVTTVVDDPDYLRAPFITSSDFRQEPGNSKWSPHPCVNVSGG